MAERHEVMNRKAGTNPSEWFDLLIRATIERDRTDRAYAAGRLARLGYHVSYATPNPEAPRRNPRLAFGDLVQARAACARLGIKAALL
ncbi:MAG: hypothetical protein ABI353_00650 [Isosphaeraceae bacterium]